VYHDKTAGQVLRERFAYCFETPEGSEYPAVLSAHDIAPGDMVRIDGPGGVIEAMPFLQRHGQTDTLGFRFDGIAYSPDVSDFPDESLPHLEGLDLWILDALRYTGHPSHLSVEQALGWIGRLKPARSVLTHMHVDLDYEILAGQLPDGIEPAFDGMVLTTP